MCCIKLQFWQFGNTMILNCVSFLELRLLSYFILPLGCGIIIIYIGISDMCSKLPVADCLNEDLSTETLKFGQHSWAW